jgi:DNA-binding NarL/FixJ family response regulator
MKPAVDISIKTRLTEREAEVLNLLSKGMNRKEIASLLHIHLSTVKMYITALLFKLSASNTSEAIANAFRLGVLE